ncbi:peptidylprolyl isomerase [Acinetobacter sp. B51(2017)]|uniref:peptidylprolyl isomerase n=1 Tax=Acinetobacter sp. B51(2017) TaxID=2060938 RepID=UPI000F093348|nr:peptidylprolyl isomerase [Acinetobacter sp. B51(2017)]
MKTKQLKHLMKATALAVLMSTSIPTFAQSNNEIVAVVDNSVILASDVMQAMAQMQQQFAAQKREVPPQPYFAQMALEQLIDRQAQLEQVKRYNVPLDEKTLNEATLAIAKQNGFKDLESFQKSIDSKQKGSYANLRANIAADLSLERVRQQQVNSRIKISDQDVANFLKTPQGQAALGTQAHVLHMRISGQNAQAVAEQVKAALQNSNDVNEIAKRFSQNGSDVQGADMGFRALSDIPAELSARIAPLASGQVSELIPSTDGIHVMKLLERKSTEKKVIVPQYQTRHILIKTSEVVSPDMAKQMIDNLYSRLKNGEDFATLAATFSNDPGSARDGGRLGWVNLGMMVPEFESQMKAAQVGQISQPFESQFGWHILQVTDTRQHDMTEEYQQRVARQILAERQFNTELDNWLREVRNNAYVEIKDPRLDSKKNPS